MTQSHAPSIWRERAGSGAVPSVKRGVLVGAPVVMAFEWNYGDPLPAGLVFTGDANRTKLDATGKVVPVAANVPRNDGYVYDKNGLLVPGWLIEGARTNAIIQSEDLTATAWTGAFSGAAVTANATTAPSGAATADQITFASGDFRYQNFAPAGGSLTGLTYTFSCWVWSPTKAKIVVRITNAANGSDDTRLVVNLTAGATRVSVTRTFTGTGTTLSVGFDNRAVVNGDGVAGSIYVWGAQLEAASFASSYIPTTSAAVTRAAEVAYVPWMYWPQLQTVYLKGLNLGTAQIASTGYAEIGNNTESMLIWDNSGVLRVTHRIGATLVQADNGAAPVVGDNYEIRAVLNANGSVQSGQSINAAAETLSGVSATNATTGAWGIPRLYLNAGNAITSGFFAFQSVRLALGASAWSMDQMRKVAPEPGAFMFSDAGTPAASLVGDPVNGYDISDSNLAGTGRIAVLGASGITEIY